METRKILDVPDADTFVRLRDRALPAIGFQAGLRRSEIAHPCVGGFYTDRGFADLRIPRKGGRKGALAIHPDRAQRIRGSPAAAEDRKEPEAPLFPPETNNRHAREKLRHMDPDTVDRIPKRHAGAPGIGAGTTSYPARSMRATLITAALDPGSPLEDVQRAAGHADPATARLYDRRGRSPERGAGFFANYQGVERMPVLRFPVHGFLR